MKNATKFVCLLLVLVMAVATLASCFGSDTAVAETTPMTINPTGSGENPGVDGPDVPDGLTYSGETVTIIASNYDWFDDEIYVEAETGSTIPDAVYTRNQLVQQKLGVTINPALQDSTSGPGGTNKVLNAIEKQVNGGDNDYSIAVANSYTTAKKTMENHFVDLKDLGAYFDLEKSYWSQGMNDSLSVGDAQYICTGAMVLSFYRLMYGTLINETMFESHSVELPYDKVENNEWTMAYQRSIVETFCDAEVDQDPEANYGFIVNHNNISCDVYLSSLKVPLIAKDENNMFTVSTDRARTISAMTEICKLLYSTRGTLRVASRDNDNEQQDLAKKFSEGSAAMVHLRLMELEGEYLRQMEDVFGIVPMPMLDSDQGSYHTIAHDQVSVIGVPNTRKDDAELEMIGAVLDLMGYYSETEVTPQYYEVCLKGRYFNNPRAQDMLDILTKGLYIDPAAIYHEILGGPLGTWRGWVGSNKGSGVASSITILGRTMEGHLKKVNSNFEKIAG